MVKPGDIIIWKQYVWKLHNSQIYGQSYVLTVLKAAINESISIFALAKYLYIAIVSQTMNMIMWLCCPKHAVQIIKAIHHAPVIRSPIHLIGWHLYCLNWLCHTSQVHSIRTFLSIIWSARQTRPRCRIWFYHCIILEWTDFFFKIAPRRPWQIWRSSFLEWLPWMLPTQFIK